MQVDSTSGVSVVPAGSQQGLASMSSEDFLRLLITQLQSQDPLEPMDNEKMIGQIAQIRQMDMDMTMTDALERVTGEQHFAASTAMIGKLVVAQVYDVSGNPTTIAGVVQAVHFGNDGQAYLELDTGEILPMSSIIQIADVQPTDEGELAPDNGAAISPDEALDEDLADLMDSQTADQIAQLSQQVLEHADDVGIAPVEEQAREISPIAKRVVDRLADRPVVQAINRLRQWK
jgi:flagellar basal-body rod modification protein FlgD